MLPAARAGGKGGSARAVVQNETEWLRSVRPRPPGRRGLGVNLSGTRSTPTSQRRTTPVANTSVAGALPRAFARWFLLTETLDHSTLGNY